MKKILFIILTAGFGLLSTVAQVNNYNHAPVIVGHHDLFVQTGASYVLTPGDLILSDMEQGNYDEAQKFLDEAYQRGDKNSRRIRRIVRLLHDGHDVLRHLLR